MAQDCKYYLTRSCLQPSVGVSNCWRRRPKKRLPTGWIRDDRHLVIIGVIHRLQQQQIVVVCRIRNNAFAPRLRLHRVLEWHER